MDSYGRVAALKIETAQDRAHAVEEEAARVENKVYVSPGSQCVLTFVRDAASRISIRLEKERLVANSGLLTPSQLETRLHRIAKLLPLLHQLLGFVDGSDIHRSPGQLVPTLRRYTQSILPTSEIVVSSKPELNYSIHDIAGPLRELFAGTSLEESCRLLPELLFMLNIPSAESGQVLIHGVLAHELGHALYNRKEIAKDLLPKIRINEELVRSLAKAMFDNQQKQGNPTPELRLRNQVTHEITARVHGWVKELSSDAIGIRLFGPALFFAEAHLLISLRPIDKGTATHPPSRLRIRLMMRMLKQLYEVDKWHGELQGFSKAWDEVSAEHIPWANSYDQVALEAINDTALDLISEASAIATSSVQCYSSARFVQDVSDMGPLFLSCIPPGDAGADGPGARTAMASIINAGWHVYLCDFEAFRKGLHSNDSDTRFAVAAKLHELVLKALEISEIRTMWEEARRDSKRGKS
jgi:hypothetical protein